MIFPGVISSPSVTTICRRFIGRNPIILASSLRKAWPQFQAISPFRPIIPTGAAYGGSGWYPTSADVTEFMDKAVELNMSGVSFWSWDYCRVKLPELWDTIAEYEWPGVSNPALDIVESLINSLNDRSIDSIVGLYTSDAIHINAERTIQGYDALMTWLNQFLNVKYKDATFEILELNGEDQTRYFTWKATLSDGSEKNRIRHHWPGRQLKSSTTTHPYKKNPGCFPGVFFPFYLIRLFFLFRFFFFFSFGSFRLDYYRFGYFITLFF